MKRIMAWAMVGISASLAACNYSHMALDRFGQPDLVGESAGALTRFYRPEEAQEYVWPRSEKTYYYVVEDFKVVVTDHGYTKTALSEQDKNYVHLAMSP